MPQGGSGIKSDFTTDGVNQRPVGLDRAAHTPGESSVPRGRALRPSPWTALLIGWDALAAALVMLATSPVGDARLLEDGSAAAPDALPLAAVFAVVLPIAAAAAGAYSLDIASRTGSVRWSGSVVPAALGAGWLTLIGGLALGFNPDVVQMGLASVIAVPALLAGRLGVEALRARHPQRVLVVGSGRVAARVSALSDRHRHLSLKVVGFVDDDPHPLRGGAGAKAATQPVAHLGGIDGVPSLLSRGEVDRVLVAFSSRSDEELVTVLRECDAHGVDVDVVPRLFDLIGPEPRAYALGGFPVLSIRGRRTQLSAAFAKRALDIAGAVLGLVFLWPLMLAISLALLFDSGRRVLYIQERVGRGGRSFGMVKFRTLADTSPSADETPIVGDGHLTISEAVEALKLELNDPTRVGGRLRRTSLDELPQLWNVLKGDMSLVGPRPLRPFEVSALNGWQRRRQDVRPGLTGLWQVLGRSEVPWEERMELDYSYVRHWSLAHDLKILARTLGAVISRRGAY